MMSPTGWRRNCTARWNEAMAVLVHSSLVRAPLDAVFAFHLDPANLAKIQPPGFGLKRVEPSGPVRAGNGLVLDTQVLGWPQRWEVWIEGVIEPRGDPPRAAVIDAARRGPFPYFRHRHEFFAERGGTRMRDVVDFDPPGGRWVGLLLLPGSWLVMKALFHFRHRRTRALLEHGSRPSGAS
jgi:ligand-binding SRPBCC domain-containing protein